MIKTVFAAAISLLLPFAVFATGGEPFAFLKLGAGTRAMGMGGAFSSVAGDATAAVYNPAGLLDLQGFELHAESNIMTFGRSLNFVSTGSPVRIADTIYCAGFSWYNFSAGSDIEARLTNSPEPDSLISHNSHVFTFNLGAKLSERFLLGGNFRVLIQNIDTARGVGFGFDLGAISNITQDLRAAISIANIGSSITWTGSSNVESVAQVITLGASYSFRDFAGTAGLKLLPSIDLVYNTSSGFKVKAGAEFSLKDFFFIRGGYNGAFTCGMGLWLKPSQIFTVKVDYALGGDTVEPGAVSHRLSAAVVYVIPESGVKHGRQPGPAATPQPPAEQNQPKKPVRVDEYDW